MVNIIEIQEGVVRQNLLFTGKDAVKKAEAAFAKLAKENFGKLTKAELSDALDDGYVQRNDWSVCITHPDVRK